MFMLGMVFAIPAGFGLLIWNAYRKAALTDRSSGVGCDSH